MAAAAGDNSRFKRSLVVSISIHAAAFVFILISPYLPKPARRGMVHYVNLVGFPGGGGGGGGGDNAAAELKTPQEEVVETELPARESLRDLTLPENFEQDTPDTLRYPVEKPKRKSSAVKKKKSAIQKTSPKASAKKTAGSKQGSGIRIGGVGDGSGGGFGSGLESQIGLSNFPYTYYIQILHGRISSNWFPSRAVPGLTGQFQTAVSFKIYRNGRISSPDIRESSGIRALDMSAVRAVQNSAPFPPLPDEYGDEYLIISLIFEHSK
jgi:TonB family protein